MGKIDTLLLQQIDPPTIKHLSSTVDQSEKEGDNLRSVSQSWSYLSFSFSYAAPGFTLFYGPLGHLFHVLLQHSPDIIVIFFLSGECFLEEDIVPFPSRQ